MRDLLLISCPYAIWCITAIEFLFLIVLCLKYVQSKQSLFLYTALLTTGLFLDALGIYTGSDGPLPVPLCKSEKMLKNHKYCNKALDFYIKEW